MKGRRHRNPVASAFPITTVAQVVLVTGGRRGIGRAVAERFLSAGWTVALNDVDADGLRATAQALGVTAYTADIGDRLQVEAMVDSVIDQHHQIDALVVNAGVIRFGPFVDLTLSDFNAALDTNLLGAFHCMQVVARRWIDGGVPGNIVVVSSVSAQQARPGHAAYGASKAGLEMLAKVAAMELGPHGIRVNCVAPGGPIMTEFVEPLATKPGFAERIAASVPLGRPGQPEEVAGIVYFLTTPEASYITGAVVTVDGGVTLGRP